MQHDSLGGCLYAYKDIAHIYIDIEYDIYNINACAYIIYVQIGWVWATHSRERNAFDD